MHPRVRLLIWIALTLIWTLFSVFLLRSRREPDMASGEPRSQPDQIPEAKTWFFRSNQVPRDKRTTIEEGRPGYMDQGRTTTTGQKELCAQCWVTEPRSIP